MKQSLILEIAFALLIIVAACAAGWSSASKYVERFTEDNQPYENNRTMEYYGYQDGRKTTGDSVVGLIEPVDIQSSHHPSKRGDFSMVENPNIVKGVRFYNRPPISKEITGENTTMIGYKAPLFIHSDNPDRLPDNVARSSSALTHIPRNIDRNTSVYPASNKLDEYQLSFMKEEKKKGKRGCVLTINGEDTYVSFYDSQGSENMDYRQPPFLHDHCIVLGRNLSTTKNYHLLVDVDGIHIDKTMTKEEWKTISQVIKAYDLAKKL